MSNDGGPHEDEPNGDGSGDDEEWPPENGDAGGDRSPGGQPSGGQPSGGQPSGGQSNVGSDSGTAESGGQFGDERSGGAGRSGEKGPNEKYCVECGSIINEKAEICPECGVRQPGHGGSGVEDDQRIVAAVLAIALGSFGAHKFYLGDTGMGILYLCFFWTMIPGVLGVIEGAIYLSKSDEEFRRQYLDDETGGI